MLEPLRGGQLLVHDLRGPLERDDFRRDDARFSHALGNRRLGDAEMPRGISLTVPVIEEALKGCRVKSGRAIGLTSLQTVSKLNYSGTRVQFRSSNDVPDDGR